MVADHINHSPTRPNLPVLMIRPARQIIHCASRKALIFTMNQHTAANDCPPRTN
jgi:hypothetical protein